MSGPADVVHQRRTCGIHGADTTSGRCVMCDTAAEDRALMHASAWQVAVHQLGADGLEDAAQGLDDRATAKEQEALTLRRFAARLRLVASDVRAHPHDLDCPGCGRRQWADDACRACGFTWPGDAP